MITMNMRLNIKSASMLLVCLVFVTPVLGIVEQNAAIAQVQHLSAGEREIATQLIQAGLQSAHQGKPQAALEKYQQALKMVAGGRDRRLEGTTLNNIGGVYRILGQHTKTLDYSQQALVIFKEIGDRAGEGVVLNSIGYVYQSLGQYPKALDHYQTALLMLKEAGDRRAATFTVNNMAAVYANLGEYGRAIDFHQQVLEIFKEVGDRRGEGTALNNLAAVYALSGQYGRAVEFYQQVLAIAKAVSDRAMEGATLGNIGEVYRRLGRTDRAIEFYQQALVIVREVGDRPREGITLSQMGEAYQDLGQYEQSLEIYQQALAIAKEVGDRAVEGSILSNIGVVYRDLKQYGRALEIYQQALAIHKKVGNRSEEGSTLAKMGLLYQDLGQNQRALEISQQALIIAKEVGDRPGEGTILNNIGGLQTIQGQFIAAEKPLYEAISVAESLRFGLADRNKISLADQHKSPYTWLQDALIQQNKTETALEISERSRGRALVDLLASRLSSSSPEAIQKLSQPLALSQIKQVAKQHNATLVQYSKVGDSFYIWVIRPDGTIAFRQTPIKVDHVSIAKLTISARNLIGVRSRASIAKVQSIPDIAVIDPNTQTNTTAALKKLHQRLIDPIADLLPKNERDRVVFLPQGELFLVPFPALMDANGKTLIERHTILTAPSIATLKLTAEKRNAKKNTNQSALVVGNPTMPKMESGALTALPGSEAEAKAIAPILKTQALIGAAATKSAVMKQMPQAGIIHLATHGLLDTIAGEVPGAIALAPDRPNQLNDGLLSASEIFDLKLNAHLAVLSACSTGKGDITGDGVIGLSRSLIAAGVPSIVVSLWDVDDKSTSFFMQAFYRNLQTMDKAQALRQAMLSTMRQKNYQSPYHWAAFTLIGEAE
jgi:CHAT domain-containing protein/Tfp pilus assembly protein PilF